MIQWDKLQYIPSYLNYNINLLNIPENKILLSTELVPEINKIFEYFYDNNIPQGYLTPSGGLKKDSNSYRECFWLKKSTTAFQIIWRKKENGELRDYNLIFTNINIESEDYISGGRCWNEFKKVLTKFGVYDKLLEQVLSEKEAVKTKCEIDQPLIELIEAKEKSIYCDCYHLDINSSFMSAIANKWSFLYEPIKYMYDKRKQNKKYKDVLTHTYGFMQSKYLKYYLHLKGKGIYGLAQMSKEALRWNNEKINYYIKDLQAKGYKVLSTNTDGIWYQVPNGMQPYHNDEEGQNLGQWKTDKKKCTLRYKSKGAYEYIDENGKYNPVVRGTTKYDLIKNRDQWEWGDIFRNEVVSLIYVLCELPNLPKEVKIKYENC